MSLVLCVTQGGETGIRVQEEAIALAKDRSYSLIFLFVADCSFLYRIAVGVLWRIAKKELAQMGRFLLTMATERALAKGVKAEVVIKSGGLRNVLQQVVREMEVTTTFLEHPIGEMCRFDEVELGRFLASTRVAREG